MRSNPAYILAVLCTIIAASEWLVRRTALRHVGTALLVILVTAVVANLGIIPTGSSEAAPVPVYDGIFTYLAPLAIFWLLLLVNLRDIMRAGLPIVALFLIGSAGIVVGALLAASLFGLESIGPLYRAVGGMFVGTYTGGSINFNAVALEYQVMRDGLLYAGAVAVDNVITTIWMVATLALPRLLLPLWAGVASTAADASYDMTGVVEDTEHVHPVDVAILGALGFGSLTIASLLATPTGVPSILLLTALALALAQVPRVNRLRGARVLGMIAVYLFLAVIGAFCDVRQLAALGHIGVVLLAFAATMVAVHGVVTFTAARAMRIDLGVAAVASQANIGGSTSALALARSIGRPDLVLPAVLIGALGNGLGTFLGFWAMTRFG